MIKICKICDEEKDVCEFHKRKDTADGYRNDCKTCRKNKVRKNYKSSELRCNTCKVIFPKTD